MNLINEQNKEEQPVNDQKRPAWKRILRTLIFLFTFLILLSFATLYLLLNNPAIQSWTTRQVTNYLSEQLNTKVSIDNVGIDIFQQMVLNEVYIEDLSNDTLLFAKQLKVDFSKGLTTLFNNQLDLQSVTLIDGKFYFRKNLPNGKNNVQELIEKLITPKPAETATQDTIIKKPFFLDLQSVFLDNVVFEEINEAKGNLLRLYAFEGSLEIASIDLSQNMFLLNKIELIKPLVKVYETTPKTTLHTAQIPDTITQLLIDTIPADTLPKKPFRLYSKTARIVDGTFQLDNYRKAPERRRPPDQLEYEHLHVIDINMEVENFGVKDLDFRGKVHNISFQETSGFALESLQVDTVIVTSKGLLLRNFTLKTPYSHLQENLRFNYDEYWDFTDFENEVEMEGNFQNASIALRDIMVFAPELEANTFFNKNKNEQLLVNGTVEGTVNWLRSSDLEFRLGERSTIKGKISIKDVTEKNNEYVRLDLQEVSTDMAHLRELIPGFNPPDNYDKLGNLTFKGKFAGFFHDFVADGTLISDIGTASMDMRLDLKPGRDKAIYSGNLSMTDFDLGALSGNEDLGNITFSSNVKEGSGLSGNTANAELKATIEQFNFKNYNYENITLNGGLDRASFIGTLIIHDDNIDLVFDGTIIDFRNFEFKADVKNLNLKNLNLTQEDFVFSGVLDLDLSGQRLSDLSGLASLNNINFKKGDERFDIKNINATSTVDSNGFKSFSIESDILSANLTGQFDIGQIHLTFLFFLQRNFPQLFQKFNLPLQQAPPKDMAFDFNINLENSRNVTHLIDPAFDTLQNSVAYGYFDSRTDAFECTINLPKLTIGDTRLKNIYLTTTGQGDKIDIPNLSVDYIQIGENNQYYELEYSGNIHVDTLNFNLKVDNFQSIMDLLHLKGKVFLVEDAFQLELSPTTLDVFNERWKVRANNAIRIGDQYIETENVVLTNNEKQIYINDYREKGLEIGIQQLTFSMIDDVWDYKPLDFFGEFDLVARVGDIFNQRNFSFSIQAPSFIVNKDDWGVFRLDAGMEDFNSPLEAYLSITAPNNSAQLIAEGAYFPPGAAEAPTPPNFFDLSVNTVDYPLRYLENFIGDLVSGTKGKTATDLRLFGVPKEFNIQGDIKVTDASTKVEYLQTKYFIDEANIKVDNNLFDATGTIVYDSTRVNSALIEGGITHNRTKKMGLDVTLTSDKLICLKTQKGENEYFYGDGIGQDITVDFEGPFDQTNLSITGRTGPGTNITLPAEEGQGTSELSYLRFVKKEEEKQANQSTTNLKGLNFFMALQATPEAEIAIVFDEQSGDILKGKGEGNIQLRSTREGEFSIFGDYTIESGEYLFTWYDVINKPFTVKKGGKIVWSGDPYQAQINIDAEYKGLRTAPYVLIEEFLNTESEKNLARNSTAVKLGMNLQGLLLQPDITFDIDLPEVANELRNYTTSKLNQLERDPNQLTQQVFGLITIGSFLPSGTGVITDEQYLTGINTLSEVLSSQLSIYLTELLSEAFTDVSFISGVDFDIAYNLFVYDNFSLGNLNQSTGSELQLQFINYFNNDQIALNVGGNLSESPTNTQGVFFAHDIALEIFLTKDRRYKFRVYSRSEPQIDNQLRYRTGAGIVYQIEFDSFQEFLVNFKKLRKSFSRK